MGTIKSKVAGVTFPNPDGTDRQWIIRKFCRPGERLVAKLERNSHAAGGVAIGLWVLGKRWFEWSERFRQVGYIRDELSGDLKEELRGGVQLDVVILDVTGGTRGKPALGVNIEIRVIPGEPRP